MFLYQFTSREEESFVLNPISKGRLSGDNVSVVVHPKTYVNKVVVGYQDGTLQLWNFRKMAMIHQFKGIEVKNSAISCIEQSPVADVVAIGFHNGDIVLLNMKLDKQLMKFHVDSGSVTSLAFKVFGPHSITSDDAASAARAVLAAGCSSGEISFWDLNEQKLLNILNQAHEDSLISLHFIEGEPLLVSSGADNCIKVWIFDSYASIPTMLRERTGHSSFPKKIMFSEEGSSLLTAGEDRAVRLFSIFRDAQVQEFSQGHVKHYSKVTGRSLKDLKFPLVTAMDWNSVKSRFWDTIVTVHENSNIARTWSWDRKAVGSHKLRVSDSSLLTVRTLRFGELI
jgi:U3 small nucleolar RNA-associated protein 21